jgi:gluconokinase
MGVSGSGKSTVGKLLSGNLDSAFIDADDLHPESNKIAMSRGIALTDKERLPWLNIVGEELRKYSLAGKPLIVACSALKRSYRDLLRSYSPSLYFVFLSGTQEEIQARISTRNHEFMPTSLLDSQFANLEPLENDEYGVRISVDSPAEDISEKIAAIILGEKET